MTGVEFVRLARQVRAHLGQRKRYVHSLGVARLAAQLARRWGEDVDRARLAGMLHDLARLCSAEQLVRGCEQRNIALDAFDRANPVVLHAPLGAAFAQERFGVSDEAVLSAIRKHTLGAASMSRLDTIVYLADALEPGRSFGERAGFEALARRDLDAGLRAVVTSGMTYLRSRGLTPAPQTLALAAELDRRRCESEMHAARIA